MPWSLEQRGGEWCVIKDSDGSSAGCHSSRADAIKQQRALYANEARMASMYAELDEATEAWVEPDVLLESAPPLQVAEANGSRVVKIEIPTDDAITASLMAQMERVNERQARTDEALVAALQAIGAKESVVNVHTPAVTVEAPPPAQVTVEAPQVTVEVPPAQVTVEAAQITVPPAEVTVNLPASQKTVTFERDPITQQVTRAEVTES